MPTAKSRVLRHARVTPIRPPSQLAVGQAALARGAWREARRAFQFVLAREESPEALEGLGLAAWWLDAADLVFRSRERAYLLYRERDDRAAAARVAVWLAWDSAAFRGEAHVASGWLERARRLLEDLPGSQENAWLGVRAGIFALLEDGDPDRALTLATDAVRVARKSGAVDYEMIGAALRGLALVTGGHVAEGMRQLDEVNAAVLAGEVRDPIAIGLSGCYLVAACERVRDSRRATQWCRRLKSFCTTWGLRPLLAVCRTQYASVCVWRGDWVEAERELVKATDELVASRPAMSAEGQARLGELRRRQGRLADAETLFDQAGHHPLAMLGRAALALDRGDPARAAELADRQLRKALRHNLTERAAALELLVRARVETGALDKARAAAADLAAIAKTMGTLSLRASSSAGAGLIAARAGDEDEARRCFEDAVDAYDESGAPFEAAQVRVEMALLLERLGQSDTALREVRRALNALSDLHADKELTRAQKVEQRLQQPAPAAGGRRRGHSLSPREVEVVRLVARGLSNPRIADRLGISDHTVHRHVANVLVKLDVRSRSAIVARAAALGLLAAE
ncbi:MAG: LuxR C-terminal-related transcriptional regulator [Vicinamibacterales bacterium]